MKTSDLTGAQLDYWVAKAEGLDPELFTSGCAVNREWYLPSTDWAQAGPIIDNQAVGFCPLSDAEWMAEEYITGRTGRGPTPLIAAMRAYVASKFGEEVPE